MGSFPSLSNQNPTPLTTYLRVTPSPGTPLRFPTTTSHRALHLSSSTCALSKVPLSFRRSTPLREFGPAAHPFGPQPISSQDPPPSRSLTVRVPRVDGPRPAPSPPLSTEPLGLTLVCAHGSTWSTHSSDGSPPAPEGGPSTPVEPVGLGVPPLCTTGVGDSTSVRGEGGRTSTEICLPALHRSSPSHSSRAGRTVVRGVQNFAAGTRTGTGTWETSGDSSYRRRWSSYSSNRSTPGDRRSVDGSWLSPTSYVGDGDGACRVRLDPLNPSLSPTS